MPAGCDFICKNSNCKNNNTGFTLTFTWPLADIDKCIELNKDDKEIFEGLTKLKQNGRKYACIKYPNESKMKTEALRITLWCDNCTCAWHYDIENQNDKSPEDLIKEANLPSECPKCKKYIRSMDDVIENGIVCPECKDKLTQLRWFCNQLPSD